MFTCFMQSFDKLESSFKITVVLQPRNSFLWNTVIMEIVGDNKKYELLEGYWFHNISKLEMIDGQQLETND
jgi:hypothetical protein